MGLWVSHFHWWLTVQVRELHHGAVLRAHAQRRVRRLLRHRDQLQTQQHRIRDSQRQHLRSLQHGLQALHHRWILPWQFPGKKGSFKEALCYGYYIKWLSKTAINVTTTVLSGELYLQNKSSATVLYAEFCCTLLCSPSISYCLLLSSPWVYCY